MDEALRTVSNSAEEEILHSFKEKVYRLRFFYGYFAK
jgi:hypothetical protein